jgi:hypothetical protein
MSERFKPYKSVRRSYIVEHYKHYSLYRGYKIEKFFNETYCQIFKDDVCVTATKSVNAALRFIDKEIKELSNE